MSIILVRHTRPVVGTDVCYGRTDLELASSFPDEARRVIGALQSADVLITSPLLRCRRLAAEIATAFHMIPSIDDRVQEMDFGTWEGRPWSDIPPGELDEWAQDFLYARPHGGESVAMLRARSLEAISDYRGAQRRHIVVTHSGVIKAIVADGDTADDFDTVIEFGGVVEVSTEQGSIDDGH